MRAVVQRVEKARVEVEGRTVGEIGEGMLVFLGVEKGDTPEKGDLLVNKLTHLRIFEDSLGKMNLSLKDVEGEMLVVSQFTLYGNCKKGRRPSFDRAADPSKAKELYQHVIAQVKKEGIRTAAGEFRATMKVELTNQGPVTFLLDTEGS